jgi:hypothetical protein
MKIVDRKIEIKKTLFWLEFAIFIQLLLLLFVISVNINRFFL